MAFSLNDNEEQGLNEINLIPLIDIMLVLMIIFLVTASVLNPTVALNLPKTSAGVNELPPVVVQISIDKAGQIYWDNQAVSLDELATFMQQKAADNPTIHLRADKDGKYETVAQVLVQASGVGLSKIAFVSE